MPLLIILKTVLDAAGKPDIAGFLFEDGTLTGPAPAEPPTPAPAPESERRVSLDSPVTLP